MPKYIKMVYNSELIMRDSEKHTDLMNKFLGFNFQKSASLDLNLEM